MEALVMVVLLILGIVALVMALQKGDEGLTEARRPEQPRRPTRNVFDASSTKKEDPPLSLSGRAYVVDGDTIKIKKCQIRLFGIDAPELNHPYGKKAKSALISLCMGQDVKAVVTEMDAYGRTVAKCFLADGRDLSAEMVKLGLAIDWPKFSGGFYRDMELPDVRRKLWLTDARQKGRMHILEQFEARQSARHSNS